MNPAQKILVYEFISAGGVGEAAYSGGDAVNDTPAAAIRPTGHAASSFTHDLPAQGRAMRDALVDDLLEIDAVTLGVASCTHAPLAARHATHPGVREIRATGIPGIHAVEAPANLLQRISGDFDRVWVVAPECDGVLATLCGIVGPSRWIGCMPAAIRVASSKSETRERLAGRGIGTPAGWRPGTPAPASARSSRWVVKPDDGAGSEHTRVFDTFSAARADLEAKLAAGKLFTLEAWVEGEPMSLSLLCAAGRCEVISINRQHVGISTDGMVEYRGVTTGVEVPGEAPALMALAEDVCAAVPGLNGFVGIDLVRAHDKTTTVIEINPRLTCAYVGLSARLGRNLAREILLASSSTASIV